MHLPRRSLAVTAVLLLSTVSTAALGQQSLLPGGGEDPPTEPTYAVCRLPNGCNGVKELLYNNNWGPCMCGTMPGDEGTSQITCTGLAASPVKGCDVYRAGTVACNDACEPKPNTCLTNNGMAWRKTVANVAEGLKAFDKVDCGGKSGKCPFVDANNTYTWYNGAAGLPKDGNVTRPTADTPAPFHGYGCADWVSSSTDPGCRFSTVGSVLQTRFSLNDQVNNGIRNELVQLREDCGTKLSPSKGDDRYYSFTVVVPDQLPSMAGKTGNGNQIVFQIHESSECITTGGPYSAIYIRRNDAADGGVDNNRGDGWHFTLHERDQYVLGSEAMRVWPSGVDTSDLRSLNGVSEEQRTFQFVLHKKWETFSWANDDYANPFGAATELWVNGQRVSWHNRPTLFTYPSPALCSAESTKPAGSVVPLFHKVGIYAQPSTPYYGATFKTSNIQVGMNCSDVWLTGGTPCPR